MGVLQLYTAHVDVVMESFLNIEYDFDWIVYDEECSGADA